ncbi:MAG: class I SAM-dependent methyltransferase [Thiohalospira sp.]
MNIESVKAAYRRWARIYDVVFGPIFHPGRRHVVEALGAQPGERVLEVGVGTGLSLPLYPRGVKLTGIDISREMLDVAERRVERDGIREDVEAIREMDAEAMDFPDDAFDRVVAMYVVSTVPDYHRLVREMRRVCKPGGTSTSSTTSSRRTPSSAVSRAPWRPSPSTSASTPTSAWTPSSPRPAWRPPRSVP